MKWTNKKIFSQFVVGFVCLFAVGGLTYETFHQLHKPKRETIVDKVKPAKSKKKRVEPADKNKSSSSPSKIEMSKKQDESETSTEQQFQKILSWYEKDTPQVPTQSSTFSMVENRDVDELRTIANHLKENVAPKNQENNQSINSEEMTSLDTNKQKTENNVLIPVSTEETASIHEPFLIVPTSEMELTETYEIQPIYPTSISEAPILRTVTNSIFINEGEIFNPLDYVEMVPNVGSNYHLKVNPYEWHSGENQLTIEANNDEGQIFSTTLYVYYNMRPHLLPKLTSNDLEVPIHSSIDFKNLVEAKDEEDGDISNSIQYETDFDSEKVGQYTVTYSVADKQGLQAEQYRLNVKVTNEALKLQLSQSEWSLGEQMDILKEDGTSVK